MLGCMDYMQFTICRTKKVYFISCRTRGERHVFDSAALCTQMIDLIRFYRSERFVRNKRVSEKYRVRILSYCIMPDRYILLLKQEVDMGIHYFMYHVNEAISSYYQALFKHTGQLFYNPVVTEVLNTDELLSAIRYVNYYSLRQDIVQDTLGIEPYPWSSYKELVNLTSDSLVHSAELQHIFGGKSACRKFIKRLLE